ncbi:phosphatase PAP2 family protein [Natrialbaceae archaeon A-gly3]
MWFDPAIVETTRDAFPEWTAFLFAVLSYFGSVWFLAPAVVLAYWFCDRYRFGPWLGIVMGGYALMLGVKSIFAVPRPGVGPAVTPADLPTIAALVYAQLVEVETSSFPSGHALAAVVVWGMFARESDRGTFRMRIAVAGIIATLVAFSRVTVGVHYPIDVVVGLAVGLTYLLGALFLVDRLGTDAYERGTVAFTLAAVLALASFLLSGDAKAAALVGGAVGSLTVWRRLSPPRTPWSLTAKGLAFALAGIASLGLVAAVLMALDRHAVVVAVGFVSSVLVVGFPTLVRTVGRPVSRPKPSAER